ncbi:MAG: trypsin-like peptidase domain-containing protein [Planctomycetota bacterium]
MFESRWFRSLCFVLLGSVTVTGAEFDVDSLQDQIYTTIESVRPAVVSISRRGTKFSGVIVSKEGHILSAGHAVRPGVEYSVTLPDRNRPLKAIGKGSNPNADCALLKITSEEDDIPFVQMGESSSLVRNQPCISVSFPGGQGVRGVPLVRFGRIVRDPQGDRMLQSTALMEPGDSGGALFDLQGRVIGIHSRIGLSMTRNYEVPVDTFKKFWNELNREQSFTQSGPPVPKLGFRGTDRRNGAGINVLEVVDGTLADKHGLEPNDVVQNVYGKEIRSFNDLRAALSAARDEDAKEIVVKVQRQIKAEDKSDDESEEGDKAEGEDEGDGNEEAKEADEEDEEGDESDDVEKSEEGDEGDKEEEVMKEIEVALTIPFDNIEREGAPKVELPDYGEEEFPEPQAIEQLANLSAQFSELEDMLDDACVEISSRIPDGDEQTIIGTRVKGSQFIISKSSMVSDEPSFEEDEEEVTLEVVLRDKENDLVILKMASKNEAGIDISAASELDPIAGRFLITPDASGSGLMSVVGAKAYASRKQQSRGFLGVMPEDYEDDGGAILRQVNEDGAAKRAGLKVGDIVTKLNETAIKTQMDMRNFLGTVDPNATVVATITRGEEEFEKTIRLGAFPSISNHAADQMKKSGRRDGFSKVISHDADLKPDDCGSPLFDLEGNFVGLNIARNSRVRSYAIPLVTIKELIESAE